MRDYMGIHSPTLPAASQRDAPDNYFVRKRLVVIHQSRLYPQPIPVPTKSAGIDLEDLDRSPGELWEQLVARLEVADLPGFFGNCATAVQSSWCKQTCLSQPGAVSSTLVL